MSITPPVILIPLAHITVDDRLRDVNEAAVAKLAVSMGESGQLQPVEVRGMPDAYRLVIGAHRVAAAQALGWPEISAVVVDADDDRARLREIDENLYRNELSAYDLAGFIAERRAIYERLFGAVKRGKKPKGNSYPNSFYDEVHQRFGLHRETVKLAVRRRSAFDDAMWARLRGSELAENGAQLDALAKLEPALRLQVLDTMASRGTTTVAATLDVLRGRPAAQDIVEKMFIRYLRI